MKVKTRQLYVVTFRTDPGSVYDSSHVLNKAFRDWEVTSGRLGERSLVVSGVLKRRNRRKIEITPKTN